MALFVPTATRLECERRQELDDDLPEAEDTRSTGSCAKCVQNLEGEETIKNLVISATMSMFAALSQKLDEVEEGTGHRGGLRPAAEAVPGMGTMNRGGSGHGNEGDLCKEEKGALELQ